MPKNGANFGVNSLSMVASGTQSFARQRGYTQMGVASASLLVWMGGAQVRTMLLRDCRSTSTIMMQPASRSGHMVDAKPFHEEPLLPLPNTITHNLPLTTQAGWHIAKVCFDNP